MVKIRIGRIQIRDFDNDNGVFIFKIFNDYF